jgi:rhodanese-related sulfurtransferase
MPVLYKRATFSLVACLLVSAAASAVGLSDCLTIGASARLVALQEPQALPPSGALDASLAQRLVKDLGKRLVILDVRTPSEFEQGHIPGAISVPVTSIDEKMGDIPSDRPMLVVCHAGKRAARAYAMLAKARPAMVGKGLWYLDATTEYGEKGTYSFKSAK